ncbi:diguanylate cyclase (GGDEF) domain-containing protein [Xenococcus sp. PCC 7305]|uniref:EAL domain-containing protein n=1 Tax=Xenococcus sp. PCC 7305 TaxID=102125 RepID=UPI0002AD03D6|nr:EAL domain-containing protein [Xenococcus sp. PCC 7305]ELS02478.1 diguanylate cyclase (GGDEF) domain-containing protein [Xenococcus sp. PCC 7305]
MHSLVNFPLPKTILIVDDFPNNLQLAFQYLKSYGYKVLVAYSGEKAIKTALAAHPDLILLDVLMPDIDGFDTCRHLKANAKTKDIPIIFMTALTKTKNQLKGFNLGAVDYITKPIDREELLARITNHLSLQNLHQRIVKDAAQQKLLLKISNQIRKSLDLQSILNTATKEIRSFFNCDLVWLAVINQKKISIKAYNSAEDINLNEKETINHDCFYANPEENQFYLQGNIRIIEKSSRETFSPTEILPNTQSRLIAPILINSHQIKDYYPEQCDCASTQPAITSSITNNNNLWGWLIFDQGKSAQKWQAEDITLLKALTNQLAISVQQGLLFQQLFDLALLDSLTQVYNRRYFDRQLDLEWRRLQRISAPLSLILCDVDCFKIYNDTYGHQQGDTCLQKVSQAISKVLKRPADVLARYGGEEFTIILPHTPQSGAIRVAETIRIAVQELNIPHINSLVDSMVTISLGVASTVPNTEDAPQLLVEAADLALYQAKERGRNCLAVYPNSINKAKDHQELKSRWAKRIRRALEKNLFSLYAQPIKLLLGKDPTKYFEILLRLTDEKDQIIAPDVFLEIANDNFLMADVDLWVIDNLLKTLAENNENHSWQNYRFSINLSGASLNNESFLDFLSHKLINYNLPSHLLCFEISETLIVDDFPKVARFIAKVRNIGCSFALDNFGRGMTSIGYLKKLPLDYLKIDGSFIKELPENKTSIVMMEAIHYIADSIGVKTVAEFVENQTILDIVKDLKIDYAQGFHLGRPGLLMDVIL